MLPFIVLVGSVLVLTIWGGGIYAGTTYLIAGISSIGLLAASFRSEYCGRFNFPAGVAITTILFLLLTALPLPPAIEDLLSGPVRSEQNDIARDHLETALSLNLVEESPRRFALSRNRSGTLRSTLFFIAVFASTALSSCLSGVWQRRYLFFLAGVVTVVAFLGFLSQHVMLQGARLWWYFPVTNGEPVGCFINRSHFGGFIVLLCPAILMGIASNIASKRIGLAILSGAAFAIVSIAVVCSMSRGAFAIYALSLFLVVLANLSRRRMAFGLSICLVACVSFVAVGLLVSGNLEQRLRTMRESVEEVDAQTRTRVWKDSIKLWQDYPFIGVGADAFQVAFPRHKSFVTASAFHHAESQFIQLLSTTGIVGALIFGYLIYWYFKTLWRNVTNRLVNKDIAIAAGCAMACAMAHALFEVAISIPLYAVVLGSIAGLPLGISSGSQVSDVRLSRVIAMRALSVLGLVVTLAFYITFGLRIHDLDHSSYIKHASPVELATVLECTPTSSQAWYNLGRFAFMFQDIAAHRFGESCIAMSAHYNPTDVDGWRNLYAVRLSLGDKDGADSALLKLRQLTAPRR